MDHKAALLARLDAIGAALERSSEALALLALGSVGLETDRIDAYSDLDFFAIVNRGTSSASSRLSRLARRADCLFLPEHGRRLQSAVRGRHLCRIRRFRAARAGSHPLRAGADRLESRRV
ncbi:MAG: hypothetical protein U0521_14955 [Anaerolineae bacterium]